MLRKQQQQQSSSNSDSDEVLPRRTAFQFAVLNKFSIYCHLVLGLFYLFALFILYLFLAGLMLSSLC